MPSLERHMELSRKRTGRPFADIHMWLDGSGLSLSERLSRHNMLRLSENLEVVTKKFGKAGAKEYLHHLNEDYRGILPARIFNSSGVDMKSYKNSITYARGSIVSRVISNSRGNEKTLFCMAAGTGISEHTSARSGRVRVIEGGGIFILEGRRIDMLPGVSIPLPKNAVHSLKAVENTSFVLELGG